MKGHVSFSRSLRLFDTHQGRKAIVTALAAILALSLAGALPSTTDAPVLAKAAETLISIEPATSVVVDSGWRFEINVTISQVIDLAGWDFKLYYPRSILNATAIEEGQFLETAGATFFVNKSFTDDYNATHGLIWAVCTLIGNGSGASGNGTLAMIEFEAKSSGEAVLNIGETDLVDSQMPPTHISHTTQNGIVQILGIDDVAVTQVVPTKTLVGESCCMTINVSVENQGGHQETFNVTVEASKPEISVVSLPLFGSRAKGWGFDRQNMTSPGPLIIVKKGDIVDLTLTTQDGLEHNFFVDYDGDTNPSQGEPKSPEFGPPYFEWTINYQFTADRLGNFTYYSDYSNDKDVMFGTLVVLPPSVLTRQVAQQSVTLNSGIHTDVAFGWNTTAFGYGNYTIRGIAETIQGENDTADNTCVSSVPIHIGVPGDVTSQTPDVHDGRVDVRDVTGLILKFNARPGDQLWNPNYDVNDDVIINVKDITIAILHFMEHE